MATKTPEDNLHELWESIPKDLRLSEIYTFDALSSSIASLVTNAQQASQCGHRDELAKALDGRCPVNGSWQVLLDIASSETRQRIGHKADGRLKDRKPSPFTGTASDYKRWKIQIREWTIINQAAPGVKIASAVLLNTKGRANQWALTRKPDQYSEVDGLPVSAVATLDAIIADMDKLFKDPMERHRTLAKFNNARQGTRHTFDYNIYFSTLVLELDIHDDQARSRYIESLRNDLWAKVDERCIWRHAENKPFTLQDSMLWAAIFEEDTPTPKKRRQRRNRKDNTQG